MIQRCPNDEFTFEEAFNHMQKGQQLDTRPQICDDYEEQEDDEYENTDSEHILPTHETEQIDDGINDISTKIKRITN